MLSLQNQEILKSKGLLISGNDENRITVIKPKGISGNFLPENNHTKIPIIWENKEIFTDCPIIRLEKSNDKISVICWDWVPGPGPGDFYIDFELEKDAINFILNYYFENNDFFNIRKQYIIQNRNSINISDIKSIFNKIIYQIESQFSDSEISFFDRGTFHKIPIENWRITQKQEDKISLETQTGFIRHEVAKLRKKVDNKIDFEQEDLTYIADLLYELSFLLNAKV
jgi:hypothetical protein